MTLRTTTTMQEMLFLYCFCTATCLGLHAQTFDDYRPFIEEGKRWNLEYYRGSRDSTTHYVTVYQRQNISFDGDTIISGQKCKKMMCDTEIDGVHQIEYKICVYEENKRVWYFAPLDHEPKLLYDFATTAGQMVTVFCPQRDGSRENCIVTSHQKMALDDMVIHITCYFPENESNPFFYPQKRTFWIEGVGSPRGPMNNCIYRTLNIRMKCYVNDECLYDWSNFGTVAETSLIDMLNEMGAYEIPETTAIHNFPTTINHQSSNPHYYDLSGRRLVAPPVRGGVYIHDGKKVMVK